MHKSDKVKACYLYEGTRLPLWKCSISREKMKVTEHSGPKTTTEVAAGRECILSIVLRVSCLDAGLSRSKSNVNLVFLFRSVRMRRYKYFLVNPSKQK